MSKETDASRSLKRNGPGTKDGRTHEIDRCPQFTPSELPNRVHPRRKFNRHNEDTVFVGNTIGYNSARSAWSYNYSESLLKKNIRSMIGEYDRQLNSGEIEYDTAKIAWSDTLKTDFKNKKRIVYDDTKFTQASYRPFSKQYFYYDNSLIERRYQNNIVFPNDSVENMMICVRGTGVKRDFSCLMTDTMTDIQLMANGQCFPMYWYEDHSEIRRDRKQKSLLGDDDTEEFIRRDCVSDYIHNLARKKYAQDVSKEDIFYYVYGYLHSPEYREIFSNDLRYSLPNIDLVENYDEFKIFSIAGRDLAKLHTGYENVEPLKSVKISGVANIEDILYDGEYCAVNKMKVIPDDNVIEYNKNITIENIPDEVFEYTVNGRSAVEWIADQYQYSVDKKSGIVNDPNEYSGGSYVLRLLLSVMNVSIQTMKIVKGLPKLEFNEEE